MHNDRHEYRVSVKEREREREDNLQRQSVVNGGDNQKHVPVRSHPPHVPPHAREAVPQRIMAVRQCHYRDEELRLRRVGVGDRDRLVCGTGENLASSHDERGEVPLRVAIAV